MPGSHGDDDAPPVIIINSVTSKKHHLAISELESIVALLPDGEVKTKLEDLLAE